MQTKTTKTTLAALAVTGLGGAALVLSISPADAAPQTETFEFSGAPEDFVVPEGVCSLTVDAFGAEGGVGADGNVAGLGGQATATIEVTPGETLVVTVGEAGGDAQQGSKGPGVIGEGGFNGGADGGSIAGQSPGGGGGGASDVRQGGDGLDARVVVAGGGGGSGGDSGLVPGAPAEGSAPEGGGPSPTRGSGGDGGGTTGTDGEDSGFGSAGGSGGTQSAGGAGGVTDPSAQPGTSGDGGVGGDGDFSNDSGGGGGGGFFGGGGGAGDTGVEESPGADADVLASPEGIGQSTDDGGGGGGGSGFGPAGVAFGTGVQSGNGLVTITYDTEAATCDPDVEPTDTTPPPPVIEGQPAFTG